MAAYQTAPATAPKRAGGRNLWVASAVGIGMAAIALSSVYFSPLLFTILVYALCIAAIPEWSRALARQGRVIPLTPIIAGIVGMGVATWFLEREGLVIALLVACAGGLVWRLVDDWVDNTLHDSVAMVLTLVWIPFMASFLVLLELADDGWIRVFILIAAVAGNDTGALYVGMLIGRHKLAPQISPKKTWEGAVGGVIVGVTIASLFSYWLLEGDWKTGAIVGAVCTIAAIFGDLAESALKRDIDIKDMGSAIPGHGGVLDRLDSMLLAAPAAYVVFGILMGTQ